VVSISLTDYPRSKALFISVSSEHRVAGADGDSRNGRKLPLKDIIELKVLPTV
jgi:hypothetical protein